MKIYLLRSACLVVALALLLSGCSLLPDLGSLLQKAEDLLPLAPIGGTPVEVVAYVDFDFRETIDGYELVSYTGTWTHTVEGRLMSTLGWQAHLDRIELAHGGGRIHCYHPAGPEYNWTVNWSSEISFDERGFDAAPPMVHLATYGTDVLVLYVPPTGFNYWHPGSRDDCQNPDPVKAHQATEALWFPLDDVDVERAPDAATSTKTAIQSGIVMLRIPLETLRAGTSASKFIDLSGTHAGYYGTYDWSLGITLTLNSPGDR